MIVFIIGISFENIKEYANVIENRIGDDSPTLESVLRDNKKMLISAQKYGVDYILIDNKYKADIEL